MADITTHLDRLAKTAQDLELLGLVEAKKEILHLRRQWHLQRHEIARLREALREIAEGDRPDSDEQFCVGYWGATAHAALGEGEE